MTNKEPHSPQCTVDAGFQGRLVSAFSGAILTSLLMTPFDVVKTRQQTQTLTLREKPGLSSLGKHWVPRNARHLIDLSHTSSEAVKGRQRSPTALCLHIDSAEVSGRCNTAASGWQRIYNELVAQPKAAQMQLWRQIRFGAVNADYSSLGTISGMRQIARAEGLGALWRGLSPTLVASGPSTVIYFVGYDYLRAWLGARMRNSRSMAGCERYASLVAGCVARTAAATVISPLELVRTRVQAAEAPGLRTVLHKVSADISTGGLTTMWRGLVPTLWRDVPFSAIYWFGYELWRDFVYGPALDAMTKKELRAADGGNANRIAVSFLAGASSGAIAASLTTPFDVAKTRRQIEQHTNPKAHVAQHRSIASMFRHIVAAEGVGGLFAGLTPRLMKVVPSCAIMISSYELGKLLLN